MPPDTPACARCARPSPTVLCSACVRDVQWHLFTAAHLARDLDTAIAREARLTERNGASSVPRCSPNCGPQCGHVTVLPWDERASLAAHHLHATLAAAVAELLPQSAHATARPA